MNVISIIFGKKGKLIHSNQADQISTKGLTQQYCQILSYDHKRDHTEWFKKLFAHSEFCKLLLTTCRPH